MIIIIIANVCFTAGESEPAGAASAVDRDAKEAAKDIQARKRRAELPSRKARSLSRRRAETDAGQGSGVPTNRAAEAMKARTDESQQSRPFLYLKKNGGRQSYSSTKIGDEYRQPTLPSPRTKSSSSAGINTGKFN